MKRYDQICALALTLDHVGERWSLLLIRELLTGPKRFSELRRMLPGLAPNLLTTRLKGLTASGLVSANSSVSGSAQYSLTEAGRELDEAIYALVRWGARFLPAQVNKGGLASPHWLVVALGALFEKRRLKQPILGQLEVDNFELHVRSDRDGKISVHPGSAKSPAFILRTDYVTCLQIFSGSKPVKSFGNTARLSGDIQSFAMLRGTARQ